MTAPSVPKPWFKAKSVGWGWGPALTWQGWLAYGLYGAVVPGGALRFPPGRDPAALACAVVAATAALVALCWLKGEKPGRR